VINMTRLKDQVAWTRITSIAQYAEVIEAIRDEANRSDLSIAKWELSNYQRP